MRRSCAQGFGIRHVLNPNPYTGAFGDDGPRYAEDAADVIRTCTPGGVAGFIAETIQGVGGTVPLATGYLPAVYEVCLLWPFRLKDVLCGRAYVSQQGAVPAACEVWCVGWGAGTHVGCRWVVC